MLSLKRTHNTYCPQFVMDLAARRNALPLPSIPERMGVRMPQERYCLSAVNYQVDVVCVLCPALSAPAAPPLGAAGTMWLRGRAAVG